jgi:hypothetical protein
MNDSKYILHIPKRDHLTGLLHQRNNLFALLMEAKYLNRTAVISPLLLNGKHNHGKDLHTSWEKYIDIKKLQSFHPFVFQEELGDLEKIPHQIFDEHCKPLELCNNQSPLLIRQHKQYPNYYILIKIIDRKDWYSTLLNLFQPSETIVNLANIAIKKMGTYHCIHVRRGDKLNWKQCPGLDKATQPKNLMRFLVKHISKGEKLYIMSNESQNGFFNILNRNYEVYTYNDFPEYVGFEKEDNYFLFMIENEIMRQAKTKIKTFKEEGYLSLLDYGPNGKDLLSKKVQRKMRSLVRRFLKN